VNAENYNMEFRSKFNQAMERAKKVITEAGAEYGRLTGRTHGLVEEFMADDAELILVTMGSMTGTAKQVVKEERAKGKPVGLVKVRSFRPFPGEALTEAVKDAGAVVVLDRSLSFGGNPPLYGEVASTLCPMDDRPALMGAYAGVGGRDVTEERLRELISQAFEAYEKNEPIRGRIWVGFNGGTQNKVI
jgi:pyruvate ferredoxin oxidoreductase alpha subunit